MIMRTLLLSLFTVSTLMAADAPSAAERFGFLGPEIFPVGRGIDNLRQADLDGDGRRDLVLVNNPRSKITLLYNRTGGKPEKVTDDTANALPPDARFRIESIPSEKRISSLVVADLNGDKKPDLAYYGEPKELLVQYRGAKGWGAPKRWAVRDGQISANALGTGDLNGDGRTDLLLLGESKLYVLYQDAKGALNKPVAHPLAGSVKAFQVVDLDGDRRSDLALMNWQSAAPFRFRLQGKDGQLGPELQFRMPKLRSFHAEDLDADGRAELISIAQQSGRVTVHHLATHAPEALAGELKRGQLELLALPKTAKSKRGRTWADVDGDGRTDLIYADPEGSQLVLQTQTERGTFASPRRFPCLSGITQIAVADWNGDGRPEIFVLSADEKQVGITRLEKNGRMPFPEPIDTDEHRPLALAAGVLELGNKPVLALVVEKDGSRHLQLHQPDVAMATQKLNKAYKANPSIVAFHDMDQDGQNDLLLLAPFEKIKVLVNRVDADFEEVDVAPPGGTLDKPTFNTADVDGDGKAELLLAQQNFLRAVKLEKKNEKWRLRVKDQINGAGTDSRLLTAVALPAGGDQTALLLLDTARKELTVCERDRTGVWQPTQHLTLPTVDFTEAQTLALGSKTVNALAFTGVNQAAWLAFTGSTWKLEERASYETPLKDAELRDVVCGDLTGNGRKDFVFLETAKNHLDLAAWDAPGKVLPALRWRVFEQRSFRGRSGGVEPREAVIADFDGDKRNDLAVLVHDRVLLYTQEE